MTDYDAVVFDSDGVLVEPPARETQVAAVREAYRSVGVEEPPADHVAELAGGVTPARLREIAAAHDVAVEALWDARERFDERSQFAAFETGERTTYEDVDAVASLPAVRGVVSNNHHTTVEFVLEQFDLGDLFDTYYGRPMTVGSLTRKKPDPHYLERALSDLGADAGAALYVGDSESDVVAARRAGVDSAFVRRPHNEGVDLSAAPTYDVGDLEDVADLF